MMQPRDASQWSMGEMEMTTSGDLGNREEAEEEEEESGKKLACDKQRRADPLEFDFRTLL